jgi:pseudouridine synthase
MENTVRLNKYLADKGFASRREADELISRGLVLVNRKTASLGQKVSGSDIVELKESATKKTYRYVAYYKPRGLSTQGEDGGKDVVSLFEKEGLFPIGRLDKESEGLLILTNDKKITDKILNPKYEHEKEYLVTTRENIREGIPKILEKGMTTSTYGTLKPAQSSLIGENQIKIILQEGKKHQVRIMLSDLHLTVTKLKRTRIMNISLGKLRPGETRELTEKEKQSFL